MTRDLTIVCFDIETKWQRDAFGLYSWSPSEAWDHPVVRRAEITGATTLVVTGATSRWQSFPPSNVVELLSIIGAADVVVTYHGSGWDIPVIGQHAADPDLVRRLKSMCVNPFFGHDDLCYIAAQQRGGAPVARHTLATWNYGDRYLRTIDGDMETYKHELIGQGWAWNDAYQAAKAYRDSRTTYAMWRRWKSGRLQVHEPT